MMHLVHLCYRAHGVGVELFGSSRDASSNASTAISGNTGSSNNSSSSGNTNAISAGKVSSPEAVKSGSLSGTC